MSKMNSGLVGEAIRIHINPFQQTLIPECPVRCDRGIKKSEFSGYEYPMHHEYRADYLTISTAGYATEIEVKVSMSDWKHDLVKPKWDGLPPWITRFIYCVPEELGMPDWIPEFAGVWHIVKRKVHTAGVPSREGYGIRVMRAPKRIGKEKVPADIVKGWMKNFYYRYWNQRSSLCKRIPQSVREEA